MNPPAGPAEHVEGLVLVAILLTVAGFAGAASFTHVKDWTLDNSPPGTGEWYGWANAVISELVPAACALVIRRRRRAHLSVAYPLGLLIAAVALSLAAQLAVANPARPAGCCPPYPRSLSSLSPNSSCRSDQPAQQRRRLLSRLP